jgi:hypothetical protein
MKIKPRNVFVHLENSSRHIAALPVKQHDATGCLAYLVVPKYLK